MESLVKHSMCVGSRPQLENTGLGDRSRLEQTSIIWLPNVNEAGSWSCNERLWRFNQYSTRHLEQKFGALEVAKMSY